MPEYAELHQSCHVCLDASRGQRFSSATVDTRWSTRASLPPLSPHAADATMILPLPGTEEWTDGFEICARHRGKEICLALRQVTDHGDTPTSSLGSGDAQCATPNPPHSWCPTCAAVADDGEGLNPPLCASHDEACVLNTVRGERSRHLGRRYWSCARPTARERCASFHWASPSARSKALCFFPESPDEAKEHGIVLLTLRRGMHGRCVLLPPGESADEPNGVHLRLKRSDGAVLCFVDARVRVSKDAVWQFGLWGGVHRRSPDPVWEYEDFRRRALSLLGDANSPCVRDATALLAGPVCELLLDQRFFNGVGNYLRAEIMDRAKLRPFDAARPALERAAAAAEGANGDVSARVPTIGPPDLLAATHDVLRQAVTDKGRDWLNVYRKKYAKHEVDGLGRAVWYRGERGALPSTVYEAEGAWDSLFFARMPDALDRVMLQAICSNFGPVNHVTFCGRRGYAFVRFETVDAAKAALAALNRVTLFGTPLHVRYKRRLRKRSATAAAGTSAAEGDESFIDEEVLLAEQDIDEYHLATAAPPQPPQATPANAVDDDDDDEWDEGFTVTASPPPDEAVTPPTRLAKTAAPAIEDSFSRSLRAFRAAGTLAGQIAGGPPAEARAGAEAAEVVADGDPLSLLKDIARSYNEVATAELANKRQRQ